MILLIRSSRKEKIIDDNFHGAIIIKIVINLAEGEAGGGKCYGAAGGRNHPIGMLPCRHHPAQDVEMSNSAPKPSV